MRLIYHDNPDEAVRDKCRYLEQVRKAEGQSTYWALVRETLKTDPWFMFRVALEWAWLDEDLVGHKFIKHVADNWGEDTGYLFPRGHGKTLPMSGIVISHICNEPDSATLQLSRTADNAAKIGTYIANMLIGNDYLQRCFSRKYNPDNGFLPSSEAECKQWGKDGYTLPWRKPRIDPTLLCIPLKGATAGKHPEIVWVDDPTERENNNEKGWADVEQKVRDLWYLLPASGFFFWTGTRWDDKDALGKAVEGKLLGKQGPFKFIQSSCYVDDDPALEPTYPLKIRWNMDKPSGYTKEALQLASDTDDNFSAQMRNNPSPKEKADIKEHQINIYKPEDLPKCGNPRVFGIETSGGAMVIYTGLIEHCDKLKVNIPLQEIVNPRSINLTKADRILAAIQPLTNAGKFFVQEWMIGDPYDRNTLGYELRRLGKAAHDDIADAIHNAIVHLIDGDKPDVDEKEAHLYLVADLAYTEKQRSDWSVLAAIIVDSSGKHYIADYHRYQCSSPTGHYDQILEFYRKHEKETSQKRTSSRKFPGAWR